MAAKWHLQPLAATCSHLQPLAATWQPLGSHLAATCRQPLGSHLQPPAATCSHLQPLAATYNHLPRQPLGSHVPLAAMCQPFGSHLLQTWKKSKIYKITFFSRWHSAATWQPLAPSAAWRPLGSHLQPLAATWQPLAAATGAGVCQVAAKWLQVAASGWQGKWLQVADRASGCKWLTSGKSKWCTFARSVTCVTCLYSRCLMMHQNFSCLVSFGHHEFFGKTGCQVKATVSWILHWCCRVFGGISTGTAPGGLDLKLEGVVVVL